MAGDPPHGEDVDPNALACSQLLVEPFALTYVAKRARRAVDTKKMVYDPDEVLWSPKMRPDDGYIEFVRNLCQSH
jgi:hypothetical protein